MSASKVPFKMIFPGNFLLIFCTGGPQRSISVVILTSSHWSAMTLKVILRLYLAYCWLCLAGTVLHMPRTGFELALFDQHCISASTWLLYSVWKLCDFLLFWLLADLNVTPAISMEPGGFSPPLFLQVGKRDRSLWNKHGHRTINTGNASFWGNNYLSLFLFLIMLPWTKSVGIFLFWTTNSRSFWRSPVLFLPHFSGAGNYLHVCVFCSFQE